MSKQDQLDKIAEEIVANKVCPKLAEGATQLVPGEGDPDADVMFIGEAPGQEEDAQGRPFVGSAGQILTELIESLDWQRDDVYITNIVKYRPPGNRDPKLAEKQAFMPYLWQQIAVIQPKLVATLGRHSMEVFLPDKYKISKIHGQPKRVTVKSEKLKVKREQERNEDQNKESSLVVMPLYHTAVALYNANMRDTLEADFRKITQVLEKIDSAKEIDRVDNFKQANLDL